MSHKKYIATALTTIILVLPLLIYFLQNRDLQYSLWIDESCYVLKTSLEPSNSGLEGGNFTHIVVKEDDRTHLVVWGPSSSYLSVDNGKTWQLLRFNEQHINFGGVFRWKAGEPLRYLHAGSISSLYEVGQPWENWSSHEVIGLDTTSEGEVVGESWSLDGSDTQYRLIDLSQNVLTLGAKLPKKPDLISPTQTLEIQVDSGTLSARIARVANGKEIAATERGLYERTSPSTPWTAMRSKEMIPSIEILRQSPTQPDHLACLTDSGKLFASENFGRSWQERDGIYLSVRFGPEGSLIATTGQSVFENGEEQGPSSAEFERFLQQSIEAANYPEDTKGLLVDAGRDQDGNLWALLNLLGETPRYGDMFGRVGEEHANWDRFGVLRKNGDGWELEFGGSLATLDSQPQPQELSSVDISDATYKGSEIPSDISFVGGFKKVGWLTPGDRYFAVGEEGLQIGRVTATDPVVPAVAHSWGYSVDDDSLRYGFLKPAFTALKKSKGEVEFLIPTSFGFQRGEVPVRTYFHWRKLLHFVAFHWAAWVFWVGLVGFRYRWGSKKS